MAKILVIDDEQGIRNLLETLLGRKGLELVRRERPEQLNNDRMGHVHTQCPWRQALRDRLNSG